MASQKDFQEIAYSLALVQPMLPKDKYFLGLYASENQYDICHDVWYRTVNAIADGLARTNSRFDRALFIMACSARNKTPQYHGIR
jgi:hypothetical protein